MPRELEIELAEALKSGEILVDPVVKVTVVEYHSRPISVMGAVRKPVTFQSDGSITLLDALARAEGLTDEAGPEIIVTQNDVVQHIPVKQLIESADPAVNLRLTGSEEVRVPVAGKIFVLGNIRKPGGFSVRDPADKTVLKMVALSEGLMPFSQKTAYIVRRREGETPQEIPIELAKIMERKSPDVPLEVGDILYVPDNKSRRNTMNIVDRLAGFGSATASGLGDLALSETAHYMKQLEPNLPAVPEPYRAVNPPLIVDAEYESAPAHVPLAHYLWILRRHGWKMLGFVALVVLCTVVVSLRLTPIYESTATIDIDRRMPTGVLGEESTQSVNNDADQFLATQVKLIQSDSVLRPVVDKFRLREVEPDALEEAVDTSDTSREAPVVLKPLRVTRPPNTYLLQISYRSATPATGGGRGERDRAELSGALLRHPLQGDGEPERVHGAATGRTEGQDGKIQRGAGAVRARAEPHQSGRKDQHPDGAAVAVEHRIHQRAGGSGAQGSGVQLGESGSLAAAQVSTQGEALKKLAEDLGEAQQKFAEGEDTTASIIRSTRSCNRA